ncbi:MAG: hypothetical protein CMN30_08840 [Sandaracinus sp.]|nr:hypothetical protein [Sandaracinus sp.]
MAAAEGPWTDSARLAPELCGTYAMDQAPLALQSVRFEGHRAWISWRDTEERATVWYAVGTEVHIADPGRAGGFVADADPEGAALLVRGLPVRMDRHESPPVHCEWDPDAETSTTLDHFRCYQEAQALSGVQRLEAHRQCCGRGVVDSCRTARTLEIAMEP